MSIIDLLGLSSRGTGECIIKIGGSEISEFYANLQSSAITFNRQDSAEATLNFIDLRNDNGQWPLLEDSRFDTWKTIEITVVFDGKETPFFSGYIREIQNNLAEYGKAANITVLCQDCFIAMDRLTVQRNWEENRESLDIVNEIVKAYDVQLNAPSALTPADNLQQNKTDYRFIREIASRNGYECYLRDQSIGVKELYIGPPQTSASPADKQILLKAGRRTNCLSFNVSFDGYMPDSITSATTPTTGTEVTQSTTAPELAVLGSQGADSSQSGLNDFQWSLPPAHGNNQEATEAQAQSEAQSNAFKLKANGKIDGTVYGQLLMPGTMITVGGASINNGLWYVDRTIHNFSSGGYFVDFELIRNASAGDEVASSHVLAGVI